MPGKVILARLAQGLTTTVIWLAFIAIVTTVWSLVPSGRYIDPKLWVFSAETGNVTFTRDLPRGPVWANWAHEVTIEGGFECSANGTAHYQEAPRDTVVFTAPKNLRPCLEADGVKRSRLRWSVLVLGVVPLKPVEIEIDHSSGTVTRIEYIRHELSSRHRSDDGGGALLGHAN